MNRSGTTFSQRPRRRWTWCFSKQKVGKVNLIASQPDNALMMHKQVDHEIQRRCLDDIRRTLIFSHESEVDLLEDEEADWNSSPIYDQYEDHNEAIDYFSLEKNMNMVPPSSQFSLDNNIYFKKDPDIDAIVECNNEHHRDKSSKIDATVESINASVVSDESEVDLGENMAVDCNSAPIYDRYGDEIESKDLNLLRPSSQSSLDDNFRGNRSREIDAVTECKNTSHFVWSDYDGLKTRWSTKFFVKVTVMAGFLASLPLLLGLLVVIFRMLDFSFCV
ncbi:hypothetical protein ACH5RR_012704 [Cinchona calisaya]|uniref:Uncharacterized protein n=1 Tax=Cinchona calisaya TaxID=153742 RepID=A0ABD3AEB2_9GENT